MIGTKLLHDNHNNHDDHRNHDHQNDDDNIVISSSFNSDMVTYIYIQNDSNKHNGSDNNNKLIIQDNNTNTNT